VAQGILFQCPDMLFKELTCDEPGLSVTWCIRTKLRLIPSSQGLINRWHNLLVTDRQLPRTPSTAILIDLTHATKSLYLVSCWSTFHMKLYLHGGNAICASAQFFTHPLIHNQVGKKLSGLHAHDNRAMFPKFWTSQLLCEDICMLICCGYKLH
jgi:hypothetical protein